MRLSLRNLYFSQPRYNRYLTATGNDVILAKKLYLANIRLAQAFHPILSQFEVILRNSINNELTNFFGDHDWIRTQKTGFMSDPTLMGELYLKGQVIRSERKFRRNRITITSGKIIASQTLGFWVTLFSVPYYRLLLGRPIQIFPAKPPAQNRSLIHQKLMNIRNFRNRVSHCEPLCFNGNAIDCSEAIFIREMIFDLIKWIDPSLLPFITKLGNVDSKISYIMAL